MEYIAKPFGFIMKFCYNLFSSYGLAIILFTFITKIILFPIALWTHKNSLNLIKIQPQLNHIKAKYFGEKDKISDEQLKLYKQENYHPLAGLIPMIIQLFCLCVSFRLSTILCRTFFLSEKKKFLKFSPSFAIKQDLISLQIRLNFLP